MILTCPRDNLVDAAGAPDPYKYLRETLDQIALEDAPFQSRTIVCDGRYLGPQPDGWEIHEYSRADDHTELRGNKLPYFRLLSLGFERGGDLLALEDDLLFAGNALRRMLGFIIPKDLAWVQFFCPQALPHELSYPGLWRPPAPSSLFCQATKYSPWGLKRLMEWREDPEFVKWDASDVALAMACRRLELKYGAHCPELVQHAGELSQASLGEKLSTWRTSRTWPGPAFDSMQLWRRDDLYR